MTPRGLHRAQDVATWVALGLLGACVSGQTGSPARYEHESAPPPDEPTQERNGSLQPNGDAKVLAVVHGQYLVVVVPTPMGQSVLLIFELSDEGSPHLVGRLVFRGSGRWLDVTDDTIYVAVWEPNPVEANEVGTEWAPSVVSTMVRIDWTQPEAPRITSRTSAGQVGEVWQRVNDAVFTWAPPAQKPSLGCSGLESEAESALTLLAFPRDTERAQSLFSLPFAGPVFTGDDWALVTSGGTEAPSILAVVPLRDDGSATLAGSVALPGPVTVAHLLDGQLLVAYDNGEPVLQGFTSDRDFAASSEFSLPFSPNRVQPVGELGVVLDAAGSADSACWASWGDNGLLSGLDCADASLGATPISGGLLMLNSVGVQPWLQLQSWEPNEAGGLDSIFSLDTEFSLGTSSSDWSYWTDTQTLLVPALADPMGVGLFRVHADATVDALREALLTEVPKVLTVGSSAAYGLTRTHLETMPFSLSEGQTRTELDLPPTVVQEATSERGTARLLATADGLVVELPNGTPIIVNHAVSELRAVGAAFVAVSDQLANGPRPDCPEGDCAEDPIPGLTVIQGTATRTWAPSDFAPSAPDGVETELLSWSVAPLGAERLLVFTDLEFRCQGEQICEDAGIDAQVAPSPMCPEAVCDCDELTEAECRECRENPPSCTTAEQFTGEQEVSALHVIQLGNDGAHLGPLVELDVSPARPLSTVWWDTMPQFGDRVGLAHWTSADRGRVRWWLDQWDIGDNGHAIHASRINVPGRPLAFGSGPERVFTVEPEVDQLEARILHCDLSDAQGARILETRSLGTGYVGTVVRGSVAWVLLEANECELDATSRVVPVRLSDSLAFSDPLPLPFANWSWSRPQPEDSAYVTLDGGPLGSSGRLWLEASGVDTPTIHRYAHRNTP